MKYSPIYFLLIFVFTYFASVKTKGCHPVAEIIP